MRSRMTVVDEEEGESEDGERSYLCASRLLKIVPSSDIEEPDGKM